MTNIPGAQTTAIDVILDVTRTIDIKHGTSITHPYQETGRMKIN